MKKRAFVATIAIVLAGSGAASAKTTAYTSIDDVRACTFVGNVAFAATTGGLVRVKDGVVDRVLTALDGLPDSKVNALLREGDVLWAGTDRGLSKLVVKDGAITVARSIASAPVRAIARAAGGTTSALYVGTFGGGVYSLATDDGALAPIAFAKEVTSPAKSRVTSLAIDAGALVVGTAGAGSFRLAAGALSPIAMDGGLFVSSMTSWDGRLYVGAIDGLRTISAGNAALLATIDVRAMTSTADALFAGAFGDGVAKIGKGTVATDLVLDEPHVQALAIEGAKRCIGTTDGLFFVDGGKTAKKLVTSGPPSNDVTAIAEDGDRLIVGTYDRGAAVYANGAWSMLAGVPKDARVDAVLARKGVVYVGTTRGLVRVDAQGTSTTLDAASGLPAIEVHALSSLADGRLFVGTSKGAAIVDGTTVTAFGKKQGLAIDSAWAVAEGPKGALLVGASSGLYVRRAGASAIGGKWERVSAMSGQLPDDWVTGIAVSGDDVFVGTYAGGTVKLAIGATSITATTLSGGGAHVNLSGLSITGGGTGGGAGKTLRSSTMEGAFAIAIDGTDGFKPQAGALGLDVTAQLVDSGGTWIASRRGIARVSP
jgi:ligand-binding sensor domain-containing protein